MVLNPLNCNLTDEINKVSTRAPVSSLLYVSNKIFVTNCQLRFQLTEGLGCDVYIEATGAGPSVKWVEKTIVVATLR